jgi:transposase-like protein
MMAERGIQVDHSTVHRWSIKLLPVLKKAFRHHKRPVGRSWRVDETYIKVKQRGARYADQDLPDKCLNNIVEQAHRAIKRRTRPMPGFKTFRCARILLGGIELMHMIVKGQMKNSSSGQTPVEQFYSLAK